MSLKHWLPLVEALVTQLKQLIPLKIQNPKLPDFPIFWRNQIINSYVNFQFLKVLHLIILSFLFKTHRLNQIYLWDTFGPQSEISDFNTIHRKPVNFPKHSFLLPCSSVLPLCPVSSWVCQLIASLTQWIPGCMWSVSKDCYSVSFTLFKNQPNSDVDTRNCHFEKEDYYSGMFLGQTAEPK